MARGVSDFEGIVIVIFLAGSSFRGGLHRRGITYRWLFVRTSLGVIICLVTLPTRAFFPPSNKTIIYFK